MNHPDTHMDAPGSPYAAPLSPELRMQQVHDDETGRLGVAIDAAEKELKRLTLVTSPLTICQASVLADAIEGGLAQIAKGEGKSHLDVIREAQEAGR